VFFDVKSYKCLNITELFFRKMISEGYLAKLRTGSRFKKYVKCVFLEKMDIKKVSI